MFDIIKKNIGIVFVIILPWSLCYCLTGHSDVIVLTEYGVFRYLKLNAPIASY